MMPTKTPLCRTLGADFFSIDASQDNARCGEQSFVAVQKI